MKHTFLADHTGFTPLVRRVRSVSEDDHNLGSGNAGASGISNIENAVRPAGGVRFAGIDMRVDCESFLLEALESPSNSNRRRPQQTLSQRVQSSAVTPGGLPANTPGTAKRRIVGDALKDVDSWMNSCAIHE
jgi:hypothetical protein